VPITKQLENNCHPNDNLVIPTCEKIKINQVYTIKSKNSKQILVYLSNEIKINPLKFLE
jgi:hypothetical protein